MSQINAKVELLHFVKPNEIECAYIEMENGSDRICKLNAIHSDEDMSDFLTSLDFTYHNGYGRQELYGTVWLKDGTWFERGEYDGAEWWEHKVRPAVPEELKQANLI